MKGWKVLDAVAEGNRFAGCSKKKDVFIQRWMSNQNPEGSVQFICAIDERFPPSSSAGTI
jgi:hypothetical protein